MKVYLVRHAHAVDEDHDRHLADPQRYLSQKGRKTIRAVGRALRAMDVQLDALFTSPLVRAVQTAELLAERLDFVEVIETLPALAPGVPPRLVAQELPARGAAVAVVGHEPGLSALGAYLVGRPAFPPLRKAQVSLIEDGEPRWLLHPDTLERERLLLA